MRVLIVGDDFLSREMMHQLFLRNGDTPVSVESGKEALAMIQNNAFDVVLTDINLPDMSGFELCEELRLSATPGQSCLPVVGLSHDPNNNLLEEVKQKGMLTALKRPVLPAEVARLLASGSQGGNSPDSEEAAYFDPTALTQLMEVVGREKVARLVEMFFADLEKGLRELLQLIREKESQAAADLAHKLAGSCANYGLLLSRSKLKLVQSLCEQADYTKCISPVKAVIQQLPRDREQVNRLLT